MQALGFVLLACLLISAFAAPLNNQISIQDAIAGLQKAELALSQQRQQLEQLANNGFQHATLNINNNLGVQHADIGGAVVGGINLLGKALESVFGK